MVQDWHKHANSFCNLLLNCIHHHPCNTFEIWLLICDWFHKQYDLSVLLELFVFFGHKLFIFSNITVARLSPLSLLFFFEEDRPIQRASTSSLSSAFIWLTTYLNLFVFFNVIAVRTIVLWQNHFEYILLDQSYIVSIHLIT